MMKLIKKHYLWVIFGVAAIAQLYFPLAIIADNNDVLKNGMEFRVKTRPVDPADPFRGRYVAINTAVNIPESIEPAYYIQGGYYIRLETGEDGFAEVAEISKNPIAGAGALKMDQFFLADGNSLRLPYDRYYMKEKAAPKAEKAYSRERENAYITLKVKNGLGAVSGLYIDNIPVEEYVK